jgi:hypothetical protein
MEVSMLKHTCLFVALASLLTVMVVSGAEADVSQPLAGSWDRLSLDMSHPAPEHEQLNCSQSNGAQAGTNNATWFCRYSKLPEPTLNFYWNNNQGFLSGQDVTTTWSCPAWFPAGICANVAQVVEGTMTFFQPSLHPPFPVLEDLVVTRTDAGERLFVYWVNQFECPWFRTFDEALAANPLPLPFNGTWAPQDCVAAT